jgi:hypothetical protein
MASAIGAVRSAEAVAELRISAFTALGHEYLDQKVNSTTGFVKDKQLSYCHCGQCEPGQIQKPATLIEGAGGIYCCPDCWRDDGLWHLRHGGLADWTAFDPE